MRLLSCICLLSLAAALPRSAAAENSAVLEWATFDYVTERANSTGTYSIDIEQNCYLMKSEGCPPHPACRGQSSCSYAPVCLDDEIYFEIDGRVYQYFLKRLQAGNVAIAPRTEIGRRYGIRMSVTDADCTLNIRSGRFALPIHLYAFQRERVSSRIRAHIEIVDPRTREIVRMIDVEASGETQARQHTFTMLISTGKNIDQVSMTTLRRALIEQAVLQVREALETLPRL